MEAPSNALLANNKATPIAEKKVSIYRPGQPARFKISEDELFHMMTNPVIAVEKIMGLKLDEFQKADLKTAWRTPFVMDSSGVSSAKSLRMWIIANLRCMLIPDHDALIYYPFFGTGQNVFWGNYAKIARLSRLFSTQIGQLGMEGEKIGKSTLKKASQWICHYRNGSKCRMPAGGFAQDAASQAGERTNFIGIDEFTKIEKTGSTGIDDQILDRNTRECFNKNHPIWCNHLYLLATAEDTMHPAYDRYMVFKREVDRGNPNYALINRSFKDYSKYRYSQNKTFQDAFRHDNLMRDDRKRRTIARYLQENCGVWGTTGRGWYTKTLIDGAREIGARRNVSIIANCKSEPRWGRPGMNLIKFFSGIDPAKAADKKAADGALVVGRAEPKTPTLSAEPSDWWFDFLWAYKVRRADIEQWSGLIHRKEQDFGLSMIMMDIGGGGDWVRDHLKKPRQIIRNKEVICRPICSIEDEAIVETDALFNLAMFKPKDPKVAMLYADQTRQHESNLIDYGHQELKTALEKGWIGLPRKNKDLEKLESYAEMSEEVQHASKMIEVMCAQLQRICVRTENDGSTYINGHHAREFSAKGNKDFAYAGMYCYMAFLCWLEGFKDEMWLTGEYAGGQGGGGGLAQGQSKTTHQVPGFESGRVNIGFGGGVSRYIGGSGGQ